MSYINVFAGDVIQPTDVSYLAIALSANTTLSWPINGNDSNNYAARIMNVTPSASSLSLAMPPANQVSTGTDALIRNLGAVAFTVTDYGGNTIVSVPAGEAKYIYVTANSTENGTWGVIAFGAGASQIDSSTLAGYGLKAITTTLNTAHPVTTINTSVTVADTYRAGLYAWTGGIGTITLPTASSLANNWFFMLRNSGSGVLNVACSGINTIDGQTDIDLQVDESCIIVCSGSGYYTVGRGRNTSFAFTQLSYAVATGTYTLSAEDASNVIQVYSGVLTGNVTVIVPQYVQVYYISNQTSGAYTLTVSTGVSGGSTIVVDQNNQAILICDGTNVINASTITTVGGSTFTAATGSAANPSYTFTGDTNTGLYNAAANQIGVSCNGSNVGTFSTTGLAVVGTGQFTGAVSGTTGTFSGAVSGTTGTFTGAVSGTTGTFTTGISGGTF